VEEPTDERIARWHEEDANDKKKEGSFYRLARKIWAEAIAHAEKAEE
jgi:hypothetical protein